MRHFGIETATGIAAAINLIAGLTILPCLKTINQAKLAPNNQQKLAEEPTTKPTSQHIMPMSAASKHPLRAWCILYGLSGFVNLGLELIWFRLLGIMLKANTFSFSWLLFFYLCGLASGSLFAAKKL
jgi:hypothetical protein